MDLLRNMIKEMRRTPTSHEDAFKRIVDFVFWNSHPQDPAPFQEEFAQLSAEGLIEIDFYEKVLAQWKSRKNSWV